MKYQRGMDLASWVDAHVGVDVVVRLALATAQDDGEGESIDEGMDFDRLYEETGRLIGIVEGLLYLDYSTGPASMPIPHVIEALQGRTEETGEPRFGVMAREGFAAAPMPFDPARIAEIDVDREGIGRERQAAMQRQSDEGWSVMRQIVSSTPCCLCGNMVQPGEGWNALAPGSGMGEEGDPWYVPMDSTWRVVCIRHLDAGESEPGGPSRT